MQKEENPSYGETIGELSVSDEDITVIPDPDVPAVNPVTEAVLASEDETALFAEEEEPSAPEGEEGEDAPVAQDERPEGENGACEPVKAPTEREEMRPRGIDNRFDFLEIFIFSLAVVLLLSAFVFRHAIVDGGSMENTLFDGEHLIISDLFYTPQTGDIIVFEDYNTGYEKPLIKRVIATEGQTVRISSTAVYVDGVRLTEDYVALDNPNYRYAPIEEFTVESGTLFVMGDHRDNSTDSRIFGCISEDAVLGRVLFRYSPLSRLGTVD